MRFEITRGDVAAYLQLAEQVKEAVRSGWLRPGDRLPTASEAAASAEVDRNTVLRAYHELAAEGIVLVKPRHGTYVARPLTTLSHSAEQSLAFRLDRCVIAARRAGVDDQQLLDLMRLTLRKSARSQVVRQG